MFRSKTLFVVGAGASKEVSFPTGEELSKEIIRISDFDDKFKQEEGDYDFRNRFLKCVGNPWSLYLDKYYKAAQQITEGLPLATSIDNFINIHQNNSTITLLGKSAIAYTILKSERQCPIFLDKIKSDNTINYSSIENTWYVQFAKILFEQVPHDNLDNLFNNISIVCFNYDRCIQHFLISAISSLYSISSESAQKLVNYLKIFHPYGSLGKLPETNSRNGIGFGQSLDTIDIKNLSKSIKTFSEQIEEDELLKELRQEVAEAETIVFLGFGFHPQNMNILSPTTITKTREVYATAYGISDPDTNSIKNQILSTLTTHGRSIPNFHNRIYVRNNLTCADLFTQYHRTLATS